MDSIYASHQFGLERNSVMTKEKVLEVLKKAEKRVIEEMEEDGNLKDVVRIFKWLVDGFSCRVAGYRI